jgi:hypothetical protein
MAAKSVGADAQARSAAKAAWPTSVRVSVAEPKVADAAGVHGVVFSLARADGQRAGARAGIDVDYSAFASAFGADFGPRLQMVALPACVLTTPSVPACRAQTPVAGSTNNEATRSVHADAVDVAGDWSSPSMFALAASSTSPGATWGATAGFGSSWCQQAYRWNRPGWLTATAEPPGR